MGWFSDTKATTTHPTPSQGKALTPVEMLCKSLVDFPAEWEEQKECPEDEGAFHTLRHTSGAAVTWQHRFYSSDLVKVWIAANGSTWLLLDQYDAEQVEDAIVRNAALRVSGYKPPFAVEES